ncbi:MAG: iron-containing alcohol dehydrogenase, partial [Pseudomonadota bacterium]
MITTSIFPGRYVQGAHALALLSQETSRLGKAPLIVIDPKVDEMLHAEVEDRLGAFDLRFEVFGGEASQKEIDRLVAIAEDIGTDVVLGIGGGKTMDTAKAVAHALGLPVMIIPSLASTDAPCSALSVIYTEAGAFER